MLHELYQYVKRNADDVGWYRDVTLLYYSSASMVLDVVGERCGMNLLLPGREDKFPDPLLTGINLNDSEKGQVEDFITNHIYDDWYQKFDEEIKSVADVRYDKLVYSLTSLKEFSYTIIREWNCKKP